MHIRPSSARLLLICFAALLLPNASVFTTEVGTHRIPCTCSGRQTCGMCTCAGKIPNALADVDRKCLAAERPDHLTRSVPQSQLQQTAAVLFQVQSPLRHPSCKQLECS